MYCPYNIIPGIIIKLISDKIKCINIIILFYENDVVIEL